jgi:hypothetical protein
MSGRINIRVPHYMNAEGAALELNAYLLGALSRRNGDGSSGPFRDKHSRSDIKWQLDGNNDYWLHSDDEAGANAFLSYRYSQKKAEAVAALFHAMHD